MKTMCPPGYYHNGFVVTDALGHMMYGLEYIYIYKYIYIYIYTYIYVLYIYSKYSKYSFKEEVKTKCK